MKDNSILYLIVCAVASMQNMICTMSNYRQLTITVAPAKTHVLQRAKSFSGAQHTLHSDSDSENDAIVKKKHRPAPIHIAPPPAAKSPECTQSTSIMHRRQGGIKSSGTA